MACLPLPQSVPGRRWWLSTFVILYVSFVLATLGASILLLAAAIRVH